MRMIRCSDMWCMQDSTRAFPTFMPHPIEQAGSYEGKRPGKADLGTVGSSVAEPISLCSLRAVGLWFSHIRGWSQTAMHAHASESRDTDWDWIDYPNPAAHQMGRQIGYTPAVASSAEQRHASLEANQRIGKNP